MRLPVLGAAGYTLPEVLLQRATTLGKKRELLPPKPRVFFTPVLKRKYIANVRKTGAMVLSAELTGIDFSTVCDHRKIDPEFDRAVSEAKQANTDDVAEAVYQRAVKGVRKMIYGGRFKDEVVGEEREFSDTCAIALLKGRHPDFRPDTNGGGAGGGGILVVPTGIQDPDEWEATYGEKARGMVGKPAV